MLTGMLANQVLSNESVCGRREVTLKNVKLSKTPHFKLVRRLRRSQSAPPITSSSSGELNEFMAVPGKPIVSNEALVGAPVSSLNEHQFLYKIEAS